MHTLFGFVTCPLCELRLAVAAIGLGLCFIGSSPGVYYKTLPPHTFSFFIGITYLSQNRNAHNRTPNRKKKRFKKKSERLLFSLLRSSGLFSKYYHCEISSVIFHKDKLYRCWPWIETTHTEPLKLYWDGMILYMFFTPCSFTTYCTLKSSLTSLFLIAIPIALYWWARISC